MSTLNDNNGISVATRLPVSENIYIESHSARPGYSRNLHRHSTDSMLYVVSGRGRCILGDDENSLCPDTVVLLKRGVTHRLVDKPGQSMLIFVLYFHNLDERLNNFLLKPLMEISKSQLVPSHFADEIKGTLRRMIFEQENRPPQYMMALEQSLSSILLRLYRIGLFFKTETGDSSIAKDSLQRVNSVLEYIKKNYYERQDLASVAKSAGLSQRQFSNVCKKATGLSFVKYLSAIRISRAMELLRSTSMPVSAIAFEVGYEELSTFYRAFKRSHGKSPLFFR